MYLLCRLIRNFCRSFRFPWLKEEIFRINYATDKEEGFLVNEAFLGIMGWKSGVGKSIEGWDHKGKIVGVMKNFYFNSLHNEIEPVVMLYNTLPINTTTVKIKPRDLSLVKTDLQKEL